MPFTVYVNTPGQATITQANVYGMTLYPGVDDNDRMIVLYIGHDLAERTIHLTPETVVQVKSTQQTL